MQFVGIRSLFKSPLHARSMDPVIVISRVAWSMRVVRSFGYLFPFMVTIKGCGMQTKAQEVRNNKDYTETPWAHESGGTIPTELSSEAVANEGSLQNGRVNTAAAAPSMKGKTRMTRCLGSTMGMKVNIQSNDSFVSLLLHFRAWEGFCIQMLVKMRV